MLFRSYAVFPAVADSPNRLRCNRSQRYACYAFPVAAGCATIRVALPPAALHSHHTPDRFSDNPELNIALQRLRTLEGNVQEACASLLFAQRHLPDPAGIAAVLADMRSARANLTTVLDQFR